MKLLKRFTFYIILIGLIGTINSCVTTNKTWISEPAFETAVNTSLDIRFEPLKDGDGFYVKFRLDIKNKTGDDIKIDWNKTHYLYNGRINGLFVFKDINPEDIKNLSIPVDIISAGSSFSKVISPYKMIARAPIRDDAGKGIFPGILPNGENGISLVARHNNEKIVEKLSIIIKEN